MSNEELKHLEFVQSVIARMNTNSFQLKEWTIAVVTALMAIYASTKNHYFLLAGLFPTVMFCLLDSYYLSRERRFRGLYNDIAGISEKPQPPKPFQMLSDTYTGGEYSFFSAVFSATILGVYLSIALILIGLFTFFALS